MLKSVRLRIALVLLCVLVSGASAFAETVPRMSTDELNQRLGDADLVVLDVRGSWDWEPATEKITGAVRAEPRALGQWLNDYPKEKTIVLYCAWVNEHTSASVALQMMNAGYQKVYALQGGWNEWQSKGYPTEKK